MTTSGINANVELKGSFEPLVRGFSDKTERGILRGALRRTAQQVVLKEARKNLKSVGGKRFAKSVAVKTTVTNKVANAKIGAKKGTALAKVGHLIEGGTRAHAMGPKKARVMVGKGGIFYGTKAQHPGTQARPWLNPALEDNTAPTVARFGAIIVEEIDKAIAKGKR